MIVPTDSSNQRAVFEGRRYYVYQRKGTNVRIIIPDVTAHPVFAVAGVGTFFTVHYKGYAYYARKEIHLINGKYQLCLVFLVGP